MKKCLVIKNDGLGDLICSSGLISQIAEKFDGKTELLTCVQNREIAENIIGLHNIIYVSRDSIATFGIYKEWHSENRLLQNIYNLPYSSAWIDYKAFWRVAASRWDTVISLRRYIRLSSGVLMALAHAEKKYCCWQFPTNVDPETMEKMSQGWRHIVPVPKTQAMWEPEYYSLFLEEVFGQSFTQEPRLHIPAANVPELPEGSIGLIVTYRHPRTWLDGYWVEIVERLLLKGRHVFIFGDYKGRKLLRNTYAGHPRVHDCCGKLGFLEHFGYFRQMSAILAEDTGLTHLAALARTKILVLQCGRDNGFFFPWSTSNPSYTHTIFYTKDCSGCFWIEGKERCAPPKDYMINCVWHLKPDKVLPYFDKVLAGERVPGRIELNPRYVNHCEQ